MASQRNLSSSPLSEEEESKNDSSIEEDVGIVYIIASSEQSTDILSRSTVPLRSSISDENGDIPFLGRRQINETINQNFNNREIAIISDSDQSIGLLSADILSSSSTISGEEMVLNLLQMRRIGQRNDYIFNQSVTNFTTSMFYENSSSVSSNERNTEQINDLSSNENRIIGSNLPPLIRHINDSVDLLQQLQNLSTENTSEYIVEATVIRIIDESSYNEHDLLQFIQFIRPYIHDRVYDVIHYRYTGHRSAASSEELRNAGMLSRSGYVVANSSNSEEQRSFNLLESRRISQINSYNYNERISNFQDSVNNETIIQSDEESSEDI